MGIALTDGGPNVDYATKTPVFVNGEYLQESQDVTLTGESGNQLVRTQEGFTGFAEGDEEVTIDVKSAVPINGPESDIWNIMVDKAWVTVQVGCGRVDYVGTGKIQTCTVRRTQGGTPVEFDFQFKGPLNRLE